MCLSVRIQCWVLAISVLLSRKAYTELIRMVVDQSFLCEWSETFEKLFSEENLQQFWLVEVFSLHCVHFFRENLRTKNFQEWNHPIKWHLNQFVFRAYGMKKEEKIECADAQYLFIKMNKTWAKLWRNVWMWQPCLGLVTAFFISKLNSFGLSFCFIQSFWAHQVRSSKTIIFTHLLSKRLLNSSISISLLVFPHWN